MTEPTSIRRLALTLKQARLDRDEDIRKIAPKIGYCASALSGWETGARSPGLESACNWADYFGYDIVLVKRQPAS